MLAPAPPLGWRGGERCGQERTLPQRRAFTCTPPPPSSYTCCFLPFGFFFFLFPFRLFASHGSRCAHNGCVSCAYVCVCVCVSSIIHLASSNLLLGFLASHILYPWLFAGVISMSRFASCCSSPPVPRLHSVCGFCFCVCVYGGVCRCCCTRRCG